MAAIAATGDLPGVVGRFAGIGDLVEHARRVVAHQRSRDPNPDDPFRGLSVSDDAVDALLAADPADLRSAPIATMFAARVELLGAVFELAPLDLDLLLVAAAPDIEPRFEWVYGYLNDDVTRRRPSIGVALELAGAPLADAGCRARLQDTGPLLRHHLVRIEDADRPFLSRALRVPDAVTAFLLGGPTLDALVDPLVVPAVAAAGEQVDNLAAALRTGIAFCYLRERPGTSGRAVAAGALAAAGIGALVVDAARLPAGMEVEAFGAALRDAALLGRGLVAGPLEAIPRAGLALAAEAATPVLLVGSRDWDPGCADAVPYVVEVERTGAGGSLAGWQEALDGVDVDADLTDAVGCFRLTPEQTVRAALAAAARAHAAGTAVTAEHLRAAARAQNGARLEELARRFDPGPVTLADLVLPGEALSEIAGIVARARHRDLVMREWGMAGAGRHEAGITALLVGPSGTGKSLAARAVAGELGLDLYAVDLATVVDKYIGETEKNLDRIFAAAEGVNAVLLFDEADALFGRRSEVSDAHDRHANIEVAYLLQRMETFDGIALLTSNLNGNIDPAFTRRFDAIVHFPEPEPAERERLWRLHLPPSLPIEGELDVAWLASTFRLTGGAIRNATLAAAFRAAARAGSVRMDDLVVGVAAEYRKLGRLWSSEEYSE